MSGLQPNFLRVLIPDEIEPAVSTMSSTKRTVLSLTSPTMFTISATLWLGRVLCIIAKSAPNLSPSFLANLARPVSGATTTRFSRFFCLK